MLKIGGHDGVGEVVLTKKHFRADDRKRYTDTIPRHCAVQQSTPRFSTPIRDADWSNQFRTGC